MKFPIRAALVLAGSGLASSLTGCFLCPSKPPRYGPVQEYVINNKLGALEVDLRTNPQDLEYKDDAGLTPLSIAALHCRPQALTILLQSGAKVDAHDPAGFTPLHFAAQQGCLACIRLLIDAHAKVNARDHDGHTPLGVAITWHQAAAAALLRASGGVP